MILLKNPLFHIFGCLIILSSSLHGQEINLTSLSQLEDSANSGKTILMNRSLDLKGRTINVTPGIILMPRGGILKNGTIAGTDYTISTSAINKTFDLSISFKDRYDKPFFPEWFGAKGDGITNDSKVLLKTMQSSSIVNLRRYRTYYLQDPVTLKREGSLTINGNNAKVIARKFQKHAMFTFSYLLSQVTIQNLELDGRGETAKGIATGDCIDQQCTVSNAESISQSLSTFSNVSALNLNIHDFKSDTEEKAYGIRAQIRNNSYIRIEDSRIDNIEASLKDGIIGNETGISRAIIIDKYGTFPGSSVLIRNNKLQNVVGEDGDVIQIAENWVVDKPSLYTLVNRTIIIDNDIFYGTRRLLKASASNVEVYSNTFRTFKNKVEGQEINLDNRTYMIAFQQFINGTDGRNKPFNVGARFENNTIIDDSKIIYTNGGSLGFQQTKGAIIRNNTFNNSRVVFRLYNQEALIEKNTFTNSNIDFTSGASVYNDFRIVNNKASTVDLRQISRNITGIISFASNCIIDELKVDNNDFTIFDYDAELVPGRKDVVFINMDGGAIVDKLEVSNNALKKLANTNPHIIRVNDNFGNRAIINNNKISTTRDRPNVALRFINKPESFPFNYSNNKLILLSKNNMMRDTLKIYTVIPEGSIEAGNKQSINAKDEVSNAKIVTDVMKNVLHIKTNNTTSATYQIFNLSGSEIVGDRMESNTIDISTLSAGLYILAIKFQDKTFIEKIVKN